MSQITALLHHVHVRRQLDIEAALVFVSFFLGHRQYLFTMPTSRIDRKPCQVRLAI